MTGPFRVIVTAQAMADAEEIYHHIEATSPQNAATTLKRIFDGIDSLGHLSSRHKVVGRSRQNRAPIHAMVVRPFIVYYRVDDSSQHVFILTIRRGSRVQPRRFD